MKETLASRWSAYRPSKKVWLYSTIATVFLTMGIGFAGAGWMTGGKASVLAEMAARKAQNEVAAGICVERFVTSEDAAENLEVLKRTANWDRKQFIEDGGWSTIRGAEDLASRAAAYCARELVKLDEIPIATASNI